MERKVSKEETIARLKGQIEDGIIYLKGEPFWPPKQVSNQIAAMLWAYSLCATMHLPPIGQDSAMQLGLEE